MLPFRFAGITIPGDHETVQEYVSDPGLHKNDDCVSALKSVGYTMVEKCPFPFSTQLSCITLYCTRLARWVFRTIVLPSSNLPAS